MTSKYKTLLKNTSLISLGGFLTKVFSFLMLPVYTKWLNPTDYGTSDMISVYASLLTGLITLCISEAMFVFPKNATRKNRTGYLSSSLLYSLVLLLITGIIFYLIKTVFFNENIQNTFFSYTWSIYAIIFSTFLQTLTQQFSLAIGKLSVYSFTGLIYSVSLAIFSILLLPQYKVDGYILSMILANIISIIYTFIFSKSYIYFDFKEIKFSYYKEMALYSIPLIPNSIMWWVVSAINRPLLEEYDSLAALGIYAVANKFPSIISMVFTFFAQSWQISVFEEFYKDGFKLFYNKTFKFLFITLMTVALILTIFSEKILSITTTPEFYKAKELFPYLTISVVLNSISAYFGTIFSVIKKSKYFFYSSIYAAITAILLNFILIPKFGLKGAAIASLVSFFIMALSRYLFTMKYITIKYSFIYYALILVFILSIFITNSLGIIYTITFSLISYCLIFFLDKDCKLLLNKIIKKTQYEK